MGSALLLCMENGIKYAANTYDVLLFIRNPEKYEDEGVSAMRSFATREEAEECYNHPSSFFDASEQSLPYIMLDGPDVNKVRCDKVALFRLRQEEREERRECAMQAGMMGGTDSYNEEMGYV